MINTATYDFVGKCQGFLATCEGPISEAEVRHVDSKRKDSDGILRASFRAETPTEVRMFFFAAEDEQSLEVYAKMEFTVYDILKGTILHEEVLSE